MPFIGIILPKRGWEVVKKRADGIYAKPPATDPKPPFKFEASIPNESQAIEIARQLYAGGKSWVGAIGEWLGIFFYDDRGEVHEITSVKPTETRVISTFPMSASLKIGEPGLWEMHINKFGEEWKAYMRSF